MSRLYPVFAMFALAVSWSAFGAGGGSMPDTSIATRQPPLPEEQARTAYNTGIRGVEKADELQADAARQTDERRAKKLRDKAGNAYGSALRKFSRATELQPGMHEAWNYLGYCHRKLGRHEAALAAYDRALSLKPNYPEAIEYRGHAYLGLGRIADTKAAYLSLFSSNRQLANSLLEAMQEWVAEHRAMAGADAAAIEAFASWVSERRAIAAQTVTLTREGAVAAWR